MSRAEREELHEARRDTELRTLERRSYDYLYQSKPGGFTSAIQAIEPYLARPRAIQSAWLYLYLAAAYGQKHAYEQERHNLDAAEDAKREAINAVRQALRLDQGTRPILQQLYLGADPNENDLASLKDDPALNELLGT